MTQHCLKPTLQVMEGRELPDPPLLRLESEAGHAYLSMLNTLYLSASQECKEGANVEPRLLQLCTANLERFEAGLYSGMLPGTSIVFSPRHYQILSQDVMPYRLQLKNRADDLPVLAGTIVK